MGSIYITEPNVHSSWSIGTLRTIKWLSNDVSGNVRIEWWRDYGEGLEFFRSIVSSTLNDGEYSYVFNECRNYTDNYIKIYSILDPTIYDFSEPFTLSPCTGLSSSISSYIENWSSSSSSSSSYIENWSSSSSSYIENWSSSSSSYIENWSSSSSSYIENWSSSSSLSSYIENWSSSSSSQSSLSSNSSSSSSFFVKTEDIRYSIIIQGHHNLLPFSWIGEKGTESNLGNDTVLDFIIQSSQSPILDYEAVLNRNNKYLTNKTTTNNKIYIPNNLETVYEHESSFYIDIIAQDQHGIETVRTYVESNVYDYEEINNSFFIPKFTWVHPIPINNTNTISTTTLIDFNSVWLGNIDGLLQEIHIDLTSSIKGQSKLYTDAVEKIYIDVENNNLFISTHGNLYSYQTSHYINGEDMELINTVPNKYNKIMYSDNYMWSIDSYNGRVLKMNKDFTIQTTYMGFDAPFKLVKSFYHNAYFVAGSHMIWKIDDIIGTISLVYEVNNYTIVDIDVSDKGHLCILFLGNSDGYIRVLDKNLFTILLNKQVNETLRFCKYCNEGRFYILSELNTSNAIYSVNHYIFNVNDRILSITNSEQALVSTTSTTTLGIPLKAVEIKRPNGAETLAFGQEYEICWISSKGITELVKIDLYKDDKFYSTLAENIPNTGVYKWIVDYNLEISQFYKIRITWMALSSDPNNYDESDSFFSITDTIPITTTTTTTKLTEHVIGIGYDFKNDRIVMALNNGAIGLFDLSLKKCYGLINSGINNVISMDVKNVHIYSIEDQSKVRIFVGSQPYYNDKWDSGEIETSLNSMYYGGGNNLEVGKKYYVHIQTYSKKYGWGNIQIKEFIMPII